ncbi:MAG: hypothetical protein ACI3ZK_02935 [Candidatus Cryptobacteroides sp.]
MNIEISVSDYIAAGSLLVAVIALVKSFLSDRKVKKLDVQLKEKELQHHEADEEDAKKADVEVEIVETGPKKLARLRFYNKGKSDAANVNFSIPTDDVENKIVLRMQPDYLPYPKLISYQRFEVPYFNSSGKPHQTIVITWDDEFAKGRKKEMVVDM